MALPTVERQQLAQDLPGAWPKDDNSLRFCWLRTRRVRCGPADFRPRNLFPDDVDQEFGVVVAKDGRVIEFVLYHGRGGELHRQVEEAVLGEWKDITSWWQATPHASEIRLALDLVLEA
jgi:hypothetical protein